MAELKYENAYQMFNRIKLRPKLSALHPKLFSDAGPEDTAIIQITGGTATGKSTLLSELIARCILPITYDNIHLGGCCASAVFINTDQDISLVKIINIIEKLLLNANMPRTKHKDVVEASLKKLTLLNCYSSEMLKVVYKQLDYLLSENFDIALLAFDSLASFYWYERYSAESLSINAHCASVLKQIKTVIDGRKVVTIFTKGESEKELQSYINNTIKLRRPSVDEKQYKLVIINHETQEELTHTFEINTLIEIVNI